MIPKLNGISPSRSGKIITLLIGIFIASGLTGQSPDETVFSDCGFSLTPTLIHPTCPGSTDGSIQLNFSDAAQIISVTWLNANAMDGNFLGNLPAGVYLAELSSVDCTDTLSFTLINNPIIAPDLFLTFCANSAEVNLLEGVSGGAQPYTFSVQTLKGTNVNCTNCSSPYVTVDTTTFIQVKIVDANGCSVLRLVAVSLFPPLTAVAHILAQSSCNADILVTATGGSGNYWYSIHPTVFQLSPVFPNLPCDSTYTLTVFDLEGCSVELTVLVECAPLPVLAATIETRDVTCAGRKDGRVKITSISSPLDVVGYSLGAQNSTDISPVQIESVFSNLDAGNYTVYVKTDNECLIPLSNQVKVRTPDPLLMAVNTTDASCEGENNGEAELNAAGGNGGYVYLLNNTPATSDQAVFSNLAPGHYKALVKDSLGCRDSTEFEIGLAFVWPDVPLTIQASCYYDSSGIVIVESGKLFEGEVFFSLDSMVYQENNRFDTLAPGDYVLFIQNEDGCVTSIPFTVPAVFPPPVEMNIIPVTCHGGSDGQLTVVVLGEPGSAYLYALTGTGFTDDPVFTGLNAGPDTLFLQSTLPACTFLYPFVVGQPESPEIHAEVRNATCNGYLNGSIVATASGAPAPFRWSINGGPFQPDSLFEALGAGNYTLILRDNLGCLYPKPVAIGEPMPLDPGLTIVPETCGNKNGFIFSTPMGGTPPYRFAWSTGDTLNNYITNLTAGIYDLTLSDLQNCTAGQKSEVTNENGPLVFANSTDVSCHGKENGAVELVVVGGTPPMVFTWSNGEYSQNIENLEAGSYIVTVTDIHYCTSSRSVIIHEPKALALSTQTASYNGLWFINLEVEGGSPPYLYQWSNGETSEDLFDLEPGSYTVTVTDDQDCTETAMIDIVTDIAEPDETNEIRVYPNPFRSELTLEWDFLTASGITLRIYDVNGRLVHKREITGNPSRAELETHDLPPGMYWIWVESKNGIRVIKAVKMTQ